MSDRSQNGATAERVLFSIGAQADIHISLCDRLMGRAIITLGRDETALSRRSGVILFLHCDIQKPTFDRGPFCGPIPELELAWGGSLAGVAHAH